MEERELTQLLQQLGDRVTPGPPPLRRITDAGEALRGRRSGRVRMFAVAAAAAAVVGGGSVAAVVLDLSPGGGDAESAAGQAYDDGGAGGGDDAAPQGGAGSGTDEGAEAADAVEPLDVTPDVAVPGDRLLLDVPQDLPVGAEWVLARSSDEGWTPVFVLTDADVAAANGAPLSRPADTPQAVPDISRVPDGPVTLVVPDAATPGDYRICQTVRDGTELCGSFTVTD